MANSSDFMTERMQEMYNSNLLAEATQPRLPGIESVLDLSCKNRLKSSLINPRDLTDTYPSLISTTGDQYEQVNITERHSPYGTVLMSPYSDTNSPKRMKVNELTAAVSDAFANNYSSNQIIVPSTMMLYSTSHFLPSNERIGDIATEILPTAASSSLSTSYAQIPPSLPVPVSEASSRIIPQAFPSIKVLQSAATQPADTEMPTIAQSGTTRKLMRPFKSYPKDSMCFNKDEYEKYVKFRDQLLQSVKKISETSNPKMRRTSKSPTLPNSTVEEKDAAYWERRRKNNAAAKRSRDARRAKEDELAIRAAYFEQQNQILRNEVQYLQSICFFYKIDVESLRVKRS